MYYICVNMYGCSVRIRTQSAQSTPWDALSLSRSGCAQRTMRCDACPIALAYIQYIFMFESARLMSSTIIGISALVRSFLIPPTLQTKHALGHAPDDMFFVYICLGVSYVICCIARPHIRTRAQAKPASP